MVPEVYLALGTALGALAMYPWVRKLRQELSATQIDVQREQIQLDAEHAKSRAADARSQSLQGEVDALNASLSDLEETHHGALERLRLAAEALKASRVQKERLEGVLRLLDLPSGERDQPSEPMPRSRWTEILEGLVVQGWTAATVADGQGLPLVQCGFEEVVDRLAAQTPWLEAALESLEEALEDRLLMVEMDRGANIWRACRLTANRWLLAESPAPGEDGALRLAALRLGARYEPHEAHPPMPLALVPKSERSEAFGPLLSDWAERHRVDALALVGGSVEAANGRQAPAGFLAVARAFETPLMRLARDAHELSEVVFRVRGWSGHIIAGSPLAHEAGGAMLIASSAHPVRIADVLALGESIRWRLKAQHREDSHVGRR